MLDTWDAAIVARFDVLRSSQPTERAHCALTLGSECLSPLDRTLDELRRRARHRSADPVATGSELTALRSAAVEVAAGAYAEGLRRRRRQDALDRGGAVETSGESRRGAAPGLIQRLEARRRAQLDAVVCMVSPSLLADLDDVVRETLSEDLGQARPGLDDARSVVVESALLAWLILRGYSAVVPAGGRSRGWLDAVKHVVMGRRRRSAGDG